MTTTIFINDATMKELAAKAFDYSGRKFKVCSRLNYSINNYWDGGSKEYCVLVNRKTGEIHEPSNETTNPFKVVAHQNFEIPAGYFIISREIIQGRDCGITFYVRPDEMPKDLADDSSKLTLAEKVVLKCFFSYKSSYAGIKDYRKQEGCKLISSDDWDKAKEFLIAEGLINQRNSITQKGKNAAVNIDLYEIELEIKNKK